MANLLRFEKTFANISNMLDAKAKLNHLIPKKLQHKSSLPATLIFRAVHYPP
jgi:hypothetical protein